MLLGRVRLFGGPRGPPTCLLSHLQLNQNLNDVLVSLEKQHGSNTFTVKAQPRCVMLTTLWAEGRCGEVWTRAGFCCFLTHARLGQCLFLWPQGLAFLAWLPCAGKGTPIPPVSP